MENPHYYWTKPLLELASGTWKTCNIFPRFGDSGDSPIGPEGKSTSHLKQNQDYFYNKIWHWMNMLKSIISVSFNRHSIHPPKCRAPGHWQTWRPSVMNLCVEKARVGPQESHFDATQTRTPQTADRKHMFHYYMTMLALFVQWNKYVLGCFPPLV